MNIFDFFAKITLDTKELDKGVDESEKKLSSFGDKMSNGLKVAGGIAIGTITAVASTIAFLTEKLSDGIREASEYGDTVDKMSQKVGLSTDAYQEWNYVMQLSGTEMSNMSMGLKTLTNKLDDAKNGSAEAQEMFAKLGLSMDDLAGMSREDVFSEVIYGFQGMADSTERAALANDLFGRSGQELAPLFNQTREDTEAQIKAAHEYGMVMSEEAVDASAKFQDSLTTLQNTMNGLRRGLMSDFLPSVTLVMDGLASIFGGDADSGVELINQGISSFLDNLTAFIPKMLDIGSKIVLTLVQSISDNLPKVVTEGMDAITSFIEGVIKMLPSIINSGVQIIVSFVKGIGKALPRIIPAMVDALLTIVSSIVDNIDMIIDAALTFMNGFIEGIIQAIPVIIAALPELINALIDGILGAIPLIIEAGIQLLTSLISAIPDIIVGIVEHLPEIINGIISGIMDNLPLIIKAGIDLFVALVANIPQIIIEIVKRLPEIIVGIVQGLISNIGMLIKAGVDLMVGLGQGIASFAGEIWKKAKEIGQKVLDGIGEFFTNMWEAGKNLVVGLWNGINDKIQWIKDKIAGWVDNVLGWFKKLFGIESPSKVMAGFGDMLDQGLAKGIMDNIDDVLDAATEIHDGVNEALEGMGGTVNTDFGSVDGFGLTSNPTGIRTPMEEAMINLSNRMDDLEEIMYNAVNRALSDGFDLRFNDRELTRVVREHA